MALMFFVSSDGRSKASQTGSLKCRHCLLPVLEAESWRSRCGQVGPPEASLLGVDAIFSLCPHKVAPLWVSVF